MTTFPRLDYLDTTIKMNPLEILSSVPANSTLAGESPAYGFRFGMGPIQHSRFDAGMHRLAELHHARRSSGRGGGFLLVGPSGVGKTVLVSTYANRFPHEIALGKTTIPVLIVTVPSSPTSKSLAESILIALGHPKSHRGSGPQKTALIHDFIERCGIELIIFDEFHHLYYAPTLQHFRDVTDWLKNLISVTNIAVVGCGLSEAEFVVDANEQLARRFSSRFQVTPFNAEDPNDFDEFRAVLKLLQSHMPLSTSVPLHEANLALRMHRASYGLLDYVHKVLEGAVSASLRVGREQIDLELLSAGFRDRVWRNVPDRLNPFHPDSYVRPLDQKGEVFYLHIHEHPLGSAVAKRGSLNSGNKVRM